MSSAKLDYSLRTGDFVCPVNTSPSRIGMVVNVLHRKTGVKVDVIWHDGKRSDVAPTEIVNIEYFIDDHKRKIRKIQARKENFLKKYTARQIKQTPNTF